MEWLLKSPQIHSTFSNLGFMHTDGYHVNGNCNAFLETILHNIITEDQYLRAYRRSINFGQNVQKDLIPLLIHAKEDKTIELVVKILVNLSIPIECLISVEATSRSDFGLHTVIEINKLLTSIKAAFTGQRVTKVVVEFLKKNMHFVQRKISPEQCTNISNSLLLLRNILHIPEDVISPSSGGNGLLHVVQNQILWNIFSHSIDKILIKLMTIPEATNWAVTMVQLIALLYKDQHVVTLHKRLNMWLETCSSDSSEDNESNTSPQDRGSDDSPMLTSEPTSDSSDTGGSGKCNDGPNSENNGWRASSESNTMNDENQPFEGLLLDVNDFHMRDNDILTDDEHMKSDSDEKVRTETPQTPDSSNIHQMTKIEKIPESSDCGYGTHIENQESISTSSNDEEVPLRKPVHRKPHNLKQRVNTKARTTITSQERTRKKIVKRGKANIINVQGLTHQTPTDDDISNVLKEFTVDFLLKGYKSLVQTLHSEILTNPQLEIDTSHFFWLITYFLKFATQIELDLELMSSVLSFDMVSYLTAEGVNLCEQFELAAKIDDNDWKPSSRRLHLVVTAIRELVQAIEVYKKFPHICTKDRDTLNLLQNKMCETDELRSLLVLLLRHYNPKYHSKQYLQDLIVTNHILLIFVDSAMRSPDYKGSTKMIDHLRQFATPELMYQYGLLLDDYAVNGEFINDCVFTVMHHVGGELDSLICLFQPKILKTFTSIWKSEFEICDDWSDLIEYVINTFIKKPHQLLTTSNLKPDPDTFVNDKFSTGFLAGIPSEKGENQPDIEMNRRMAHEGSSASHYSNERWTEDELLSLSRNHQKCQTLPDRFGEILKCLKENGTIKSGETVVKELHRQKSISRELEKLSKGEANREEVNNDSKFLQINEEMGDVEIGKLFEQLRQDGKTKSFDWIQRALLETCYAKLHIEKRYYNEFGSMRDKNELHKFKNLLKQEIKECPVMSPVSYHALLINQSVPLVPWNCEQASMCKDLKLLELLHKLGFQMPVDTGNVFIRIPHVWSAHVLYEVAGSVASIDTTKLKFTLDDITSHGSSKIKQQTDSMMAKDFTKDVKKFISRSENGYQINKRKYLAAIVNFTPMPVSPFTSSVQDEASERSWLEVVQQSQELLTCPLESVSETASVASELTHMYVSDEDEKQELALRMSAKVKPILKEKFSCDSDSGGGAIKRPRVYAPSV